MVQVRRISVRICRYPHQLLVFITSDQCAPEAFDAAAPLIRLDVGCVIISFFFDEATGLNPVNPLQSRKRNARSNIATVTSSWLSEISGRRRWILWSRPGALHVCRGCLVQGGSRLSSSTAAAVRISYPGNVHSGKICCPLPALNSGCLSYFSTIQCSAVSVFLHGW